MGWRATVGTAFTSMVVITAACGDGNPPLIGDSVVDASAPDTVGFAEAEASACNVGPGLAVCDCTEISFLTDVPNLVFVLDRSGSMSDNNKWTTIRIVVADLMKGLGPRANFGVEIFPNPNSTDQCASGLLAMSVRPGDFPPGTQGPTTTIMLKVTSAPPSGGTPTAQTLTDLLPTLSALTGRTFVILATDGGPNCDASATCGASTCIDNIESAGGCTTTGANCCDPTIYGPLDCLDAQPTINAVASVAAIGVPTYVIGVPGSGPYAGLLDQLATAGGTARSSEPLYYPVDSADQASFESALSQVAAKITGTCTLKLASAPADPTHVNVYFDNVPVPADPVNGWTLVGSTITLEGTSCTEVLNGDVLNVRVAVGCPTAQPN